MLHVQDIMTTTVHVAHLDDSLLHIRATMDSLQVHHLPVVDHEQLVGVISDRDVLTALSPYIDTPSERSADEACLRRPAHQIMSRNVQTIAPNLPAAVAAGMLLDRGVSCLPVVDQDNRLVGIVTWRDLLSAAIRGFATEDITRDAA